MQIVVVVDKQYCSLWMACSIQVCILSNTCDCGLQFSYVR